MTWKIEIFGQHFVHFGRLGHFGPFWGVKKVVFGTFSKLFGSCLGSVWALFLDLKDKLLGDFSAPKVHK